MTVDHGAQMNRGGVDLAVFVAHKAVIFGAFPAQFAFKRLLYLVLVVVVIKIESQKFRGSATDILRSLSPIFGSEVQPRHNPLQTARFARRHFRECVAPDSKQKE